ncbi:MAG TPA: hypothetical protein VF572_00090 [Candidatus Saccharimonadales bacterium]|jgi:hypothetical protein
MMSAAVISELSANIQVLSEDYAVYGQLYKYLDSKNQAALNVRKFALRENLLHIFLVMGLTAEHALDSSLQNMMQASWQKHERRRLAGQAVTKLPTVET